MKIAVVTLFNENYAELAKFSIKNKQAYCKKHGYDFYYYSESLDLTRPIHWSKIIAVQKILETNKYDWIWWIDIDSLIMNFDYKLEFIIDNKYELIFSKNNHSYITTGSCFFKNTNLVKQFLIDAYKLEKPYLIDLNYNIFDHEQQSIRLLLKNELLYSSVTKLIHERICNSYCETIDPTVLHHYANWNNEDNIYKTGDFIIQFCGRNFEKKLSDFLKYLLPTNITVTLLSDDEDIVNLQKSLINTDKYNINFYCPKLNKKNKYPSYSALINECINEIDDEFMIFVNPKSTPNNEDVDFIIKNLHLGYGFVTRINFGLFGTTKELFRTVGLLDERFIGGEYEDNDFALRLKLHNISVYAEYDLNRYNFKTTFSMYNECRGVTHSIFQNKWKVKGNDIYIAERNTFNKQLSIKHNIKNNNIKYYWDCFDKSYISQYNGVFLNCVDKSIFIVKDEIEKPKIITLFIKIKKYEDKIFIQYDSDIYHDQMLCISTLDVTNPTLHAASQVNSIYTGMWWCSSKLDSNVTYEIRLFFKEVILYRSVLPVEKTIDLEFTLPI